MQVRIFVLSLLFQFNLKSHAQPDYVQYVNPFIGTGGHGHTFPGATVPFGMVQLSPDTRIDGSWDGCSGYHNSDSLIYGFSHTHLSGTGCSDYGDFMLMPMSGAFSFAPKTYASKFDRNSEKAVAGFYSLHLNDDNIDAEFTTTTRVGFHKYRFNQGGMNNLILDLEHRDKLLEGEIKIINSRTVYAYRRSEAWAKDQQLYAVITFSKPFADTTIQKNKKAAFVFDMKKDEWLMVKVALSAVDYDGAMKNMKAEADHWDFEQTKQEARNLWNKELSKIEVTSSDKGKLTVFYSALYHCFIQPNIYNDVDGRYRGRDLKIHQADHDYYTVFSLWDTFRAWHPLMTMIDVKRTVDFIKTFLLQYEQGGLLPVWELSSNETECMIGYHAVSVIADAITKGIKGFDYEKALEACKKSAEARDRFGLGAYMDKGFLELEDEHESVSKTLEYAYNDWCIAQIAQQLGKDEDYKRFYKRSQSWRNLINPENGFMNQRSNGGFQKPFDPFEVNNNYTEANAWQYTFFVPHAINDFMTYTYGNAGFEKKLDALFSVSSKTTGREQSDITGLIGQYAHGNEPSHHIAYLYNYLNKPYKTQKLIHQIQTDFYKNTPDGLIGNEDCGQMSAWHVLSALGLYSVCPGTGEYVIGTPWFDNIKVKTPSGKTFEIKTSRESANSFYVSRMLLNDAIYTKWSINFADIINGGTFEFKLTDNAPEPKQYDLPRSESLDPANVDLYEMPSPSINSASITFKDSLVIDITRSPFESTIYYTVGGDFEKPEKKIFTNPFTIYKTSTINVWEEDVNYKTVSKTSTAKFYKLPHPYWKINIIAKYKHEYHAGGDEGIIDGLFGDENWRKGRWQGYEAQDFECVVDLGKTENLSTFSARCLQDTRAWIMMPVNVEFFISEDGKKFTYVGKVENTVKPDDYTAQIKDFQLGVKKFYAARYVKVRAKNFGKLPEWHQGHPFNGDAYIFVDEVNFK